MIIQNQDITIGSQEISSQYKEVHETLDIVSGQNRWHSENHELDGRTETNSSFVHTESPAFQLDISIPARQLTSKSSYMTDDSEMTLPSKLQITKGLLEKVFGIDVKIVDFSRDNPETSSSGSSASPTEVQSTENSNSSQRAMRYSYHEIQYTKEGVAFNAKGSVTTEDGREINFDVQMEMSHETYRELSLEIRSGNQELIDPLVLNMDGAGVKLTEEKYNFDLDNDGEAEEISFLQQGSGFLVWDRNQNQQVDNGSELFGPTTDNGFLELKAFDSDNNQWIDEKDPIFYQLSLWTKDSEGNDQLTSLSDQNIGALYVNSTSTEMDLNGGQLRETGIYLSESGAVNMLQEVDLMV